PARRGSTPPDPPGPRGPGQPNCPECPRGSPGPARPGRSTYPSHARSAQPPHGTPGRTSSVSLTSLLLIADASTVSGECHRAHVLICVLAWRLRKAWAPMTFTDEHPPQRDNPVAPKQ